MSAAGSNGEWRTRLGVDGDDGEPTSNRLWIERMAGALGFDALSDRLFGRRDLGAYLLFGLAFFVDVPVLSTIQYVQRGFHPYLVNPSTIIVPFGLAFGIWGARRLRDRYEATVAEILTEGHPEAFGQAPGPIVRTLLWFSTDGSPDRPTSLLELVSDRLRILGLLVGWGYHVSWLVFNPDAMQYVFEMEGPIIGPIKYFGIIALVYYVIGVDFAAVYVGILLVAPLKLRRTGLIDFQDPLGYGRLKPLGDLIKSGTLYYFLAVGVWVVFTGLSNYFARTGSPIPAVAMVSTLGIAILIVFGVVLFVLPILVVHGHMKHAKHQKIQQLAHEVERRGPEGDEMMFPETKIPESVDEGHDYIQYFIKLTKVENTREYPIDVSHLQELVLAALVPYVAHVTVTFLLSYSGGGH